MFYLKKSENVEPTSFSGKPFKIFFRIDGVAIRLDFWIYVFIVSAFHQENIMTDCLVNNNNKRGDKMCLILVGSNLSWHWTYLFVNHKI